MSLQGAIELEGYGSTCGSSLRIFANTQFTFDLDQGGTVFKASHRDILWFSILRSTSIKASSLIDFLWVSLLYYKIS